MVYYSLRTYIKNAIKVAVLLMFVILRHPAYKAKRNEVGNLDITDRDGGYRGYIDFYGGYVEII